MAMPGCFAVARCEVETRLSSQEESRAVERRTSNWSQFSAKPKKRRRPQHLDNAAPSTAVVAAEASKAKQGTCAAVNASGEARQYPTADSEAPPRAAAILGQCSCGSVTYRHLTKMGRDIWGVFICHCSQCPDNSKTWKDPDMNTTGAPWAAVPRPEYSSKNGALVRNQTSAFAERGSCRNCGDSMYIRYACEAHTDWVWLGTLDEGVLPAGGVSRQHIHCNHDREIDSNGFLIHKSWQCWEPDPCRPKDMPVPTVCNECFQLCALCKCLNKKQVAS